ncbi:MAG: GLUG motif-containing protein, partial [Planctomycetota bacterium]
EEGSIIDCYATGSVSSDKYSRYLGGLCGISVEGSISDCYATGSVDGYFEVGGLFGRSGEGFSNCYATGSVGGYYWVGGLIGFTRYTEYQNCYATGSVSGYHWVGGLVGENHSRISNCYAAGEVSSWNNSREIGGLIGLNGALISNCYAVGQVTSGDDSYDIGGLAGSNGGAFRNCFWDVNSSGLDTSDGGEGKTTTEMQTESTFTGAGWDFGSPVWFIDEGVDYPRLWWEMLEPTELLGMLADDVVGLVGHEAIANSLLAKIDAAIEKLDDGNAKNDKAGVNMLEAFVNAVKAQRGKKISGDDADYLVAGAEQIIGMVNGDCEKPPE